MMFLIRKSLPGRTKPLLQISSSLIRAKHWSSTYEQSIDFENGGAEKFWDEQAKNVHWFKPYEKVLSYKDQSLLYTNQWFEGGQTNTCYNALDIHVQAGLGDKIALIYDSASSGQLIKKTYTYQQMLTEVQNLASVLKNRFHVQKGDIVTIYMPMIPEATFAMLACQRIGAIHTVVFGGFAPHELALRIMDAPPKIILTANYGIETNQKYIDYQTIVQQAVQESNCTCPILTFIRPHPTHLYPLLDSPNNFDWETLTSHHSSSPIECTPVESNHPAYILYTSGTTGKPKGVVRPTGGHMVALKWSMKHLYGIQQNQTFWAASDIGWVVGHSYIVYGPLLYGATTVLYEGKPVGTPDASAFWRVISENHVSSVFLAPTAVRAIKKEDPTAKGLHKYDVSSLKSVFVAGERCDGATLNWLISLFDNRIPIVDHWWQTETGWPICAKMLGLEHEKNYTTSIQPGSSNTPVCGWDVRILPSSSSEDYQIEQDDHSQLKGDIVVKLPLPPGAFTTLWNNENRFVEAYMKKHFGFYHTGDAGYKDDSENVFVMSRTDDVINVAAHRLSTAVMEDVLCRHVNVVECAVVGMKDEMKGQVPVGFIVLGQACDSSTYERIEKECIGMIRNQVGAIASCRRVMVVDKLPKTRSGKIVRNCLRQILNAEPFKAPATIDDVQVLIDIQTLVNKEF